MSLSLTIISIVFISLLISLLLYRRIPRIRKHNDLSILDEALQKKLKDREEAPIYPDRERTF